jgi:N utilization substance protein B
MPNDPKQNQVPEASNSKSFCRAGRQTAREYALQAMYQWQVAGAPLSEIETEFLFYHGSKNSDKKLDIDYFKLLIHGIPKHQVSIDESMQAFLGRPISEIDPIELAVLRVAIFELLKCPEIPYRVIINEALELTKSFGSIEGHKFVNGILDRVAKEQRKVEIGMGKQQKKK